MSGEFLHAPPDQFGFLDDNTFQITLAAYLGQVCPAMVPLVDRYFSKNGARLDKYGRNLGAAVIPGAGHHVVRAL